MNQTGQGAWRRAAGFVRIAAVVGGVTPALVGCGGGGNGIRDEDQDTTRVVPQPGWKVREQTRVRAKKKWTFLVYMNGANSLEQYGTLNLNQMEQVGSGADLNVVVQFKRTKGLLFPADDDRSDGDWTGTRRYLVAQDGDPERVSSQPVAERPDADMGDPATLREFVEWGVKAYPAERYAVVLWNHGVGWRSHRAAAPSGRAAGVRGLGEDEETGSRLSTDELTDALDIGQPWDAVLSDACIMQMAEVAHALQGRARWMVGSVEDTPAAGYPYHALLRRLAAAPDADGRELGRFAVEEMRRAYPRDPLLTHSVVDVSAAGEVTASLNGLGAALLAAKGAYGAQIADAREQAESMSSFPENRDLIDFARLVGEGIADPAVRAAAARAEQTASAAVAHSITSPGHPRVGGLAVYLPRPSVYARDDAQQVRDREPRYAELAFSRAAPHWQGFLAQGPR